MRILLLLIVLCSYTVSISGQDSTEIQNAKKGILKLWADRNEARLRRDRKALEQLFTADYVWVHGVGYLDDKEAAIYDQLNTDSIQALPIPDLSTLKVYGNVAILKRLDRSPQGTPSYYTSIFIKQEGRWLFAHGQTTLFQAERKFIQLPVESLAAFAGKYERDGRLLTVTNQADTLHVQMSRIPRRMLLAVAENRFFDKLGSEYTFFKNPQGQVTHFILRFPNSPEVRWNCVQ